MIMIPTQRFVTLRSGNKDMEYAQLYVTENMKFYRALRKLPNVECFAFFRMRFFHNYDKKK